MLLLLLLQCFPQGGVAVRASTFNETKIKDIVIHEMREEHNDDDDDEDVRRAKNNAPAVAGRCRFDASSLLGCRHCCCFCFRFCYTLLLPARHHRPAKHPID